MHAYVEFIDPFLGQYLFFMLESFSHNVFFIFFFFP